MHPFHQHVLQTRRNFLATSASGIGTLALASLLRDGGLVGAPAAPVDSANLLAPKAPHFEAKAKACICIFLEGAPSQMDLFDPKPKLNEMHGEKLPESFTKNERFAFIEKDTARILGSPRRFTKHGA